jgi:hypothetical protein
VFVACMPRQKMFKVCSASVCDKNLLI